MKNVSFDDVDQNLFLPSYNFSQTQIGKRTG